MQRPTGVTILAVLAFCGAGLLVIFALISLLGGAVVSTLASSRMGSIAGMGVAVLGIFLLFFAVVDLVIGVGLLKLKNWARIVTVIICVLALLSTVLSILNPFHVHVFFFFFLIRRLVFAAIYAWILWYLFQPHVKQAFGAADF